MFLVGCVPPEPYVYIPSHPEIAVVDDSKSAGSQTWVQIAGFEQHSIAGLQSWQVHELPQGKEVIFWGVGYVDAINAFDDWQYTVDRYEAQVQYLFSQTSSEIICLYADIEPYLVLEAHIKAWEGIQAVMLRECPMVVVYDDWGYHHSSSDGVHGTREDNQAMGKSAIEWFEAR